MNFPIPDFTKANILVVGDVMLDRYWHGSTERISPEAPVPVVRIGENEDRPGGAGNVALNIRALGANVSLLACRGADANGEILENKLKSADIECHFLLIPNKPTIAKLRILSLHQQLIRLDFEESFAHGETALLSSQYVTLLDQQKFDVIILSDYHKGTLANASTFILEANKRNIPILVDPKGNDYRIYKGATLLTPNRKEFEAIVGTCTEEDALVAKGMNLLNQLELQGLLITRGAQGMTLLQRGEVEYSLPAKAREVYDVTGAGDTVIAVLAAAIAAGSSYQDAVTVANIAAGIVVGKLGAASVNISELRRALQNQNASGSGIMTEDQLLIAVADAKAHGEKVVMTNGCFDILHAGHVAYLTEAKQLGDRLIIAVNDDASVARLKGRHRPINKLAERMTVLSALNVVDWVVPFSEDTPERLICRILPDVLVKASDYENKYIAGSECVLRQGGEVKLLKYIEGLSTSAIVKKLTQEEFA